MKEVKEVKEVKEEGNAERKDKEKKEKSPLPSDSVEASVFLIIINHAWFIFYRRQFLMIIRSS